MADEYCMVQFCVVVAVVMGRWVFLWINNIKGCSLYSTPHLKGHEESTGVVSGFPFIGGRFLNHLCFQKIIGQVQRGDIGKHCHCLS